MTVDEYELREIGDSLDMIADRFAILQDLNENGLLELYVEILGLYKRVRQEEKRRYNHQFLSRSG